MTTLFAGKAEERSSVSEVPSVAAHAALRQPDPASANAASNSRQEPERAPVKGGTEERLELISEPLRRYAAEEFHKGWAEVRTDVASPEELALAMRYFESTVRDYPFEAGMKMAHERLHKEQMVDFVQSQDPFKVLSALKDPDIGPLSDLVRDGGRFEALFRPLSPILGTVVNMPVSWVNDSVQEGQTLEFPPGVYRLDERFSILKTIPRDLTVTGAGRDRTLIALRAISPGERLVNLRIRDCTLYCDNDSLIEIQESAATIVLDRVRLIGFDSGAGGSHLFHAKGLALLARACRFEGGYGRSPGSGTLFSTETGRILARFENCSLSNLSLGLSSWSPRVTVVFYNSLLTGIRDWSRAAESLPHLPGVHFDGTLPEAADYVGNAPVRDLNHLFPGWERALQD